MSNQRYPEEFKIEAVKQVTARGLPDAEVAARLEDVRAQSICLGKARQQAQEQRVCEDDQQAELRRLRAELKRATEERDILKRPPRTFPRFGVIQVARLPYVNAGIKFRYITMLKKAINQMNFKLYKV